MKNMEERKDRRCKQNFSISVTCSNSGRTKCSVFCSCAHKRKGSDLLFLVAMQIFNKNLQNSLWLYLQHKLHQYRNCQTPVYVFGIAKLANYTSNSLIIILTESTSSPISLLLVYLFQYTYLISFQLISRLATIIITVSYCLQVRNY